MEILFFALLVIAILFVLIFVHELGHFGTAKLFRLKVDEFGFGFPPRIWGKKIGDTLYSINWFPFGGFVKIFGEDGSGKADERSFSNQKAWKRFVILVAGAAMNFLLGWALISILFATSGIRMPVTDENRSYIQDARLTIVAVTSDSPAQEAGIQVGDFVVAITAPVESPEEIIPQTYEEFVSVIKNYKGQEILLHLERGGESLGFTLTPRADPPAGEGALGIVIPETGNVRYTNVLEAVGEGFSTSLGMSKLVLAAFGGLVKDLVTTAPVEGEFVGPVGIVGVIVDASRIGIANVLQLMAIISLNLAVLNLLPIPALDGGRVLFVIIEKIKGSPVPERIEQLFHGVGFALLIVLLIVITIKDVSTLF